MKNISTFLRIYFVLLFIITSSLAYSQLGNPPNVSAPANGASVYVGSTLNFGWIAILGATFDVEFYTGQLWASIINVPTYNTLDIVISNNQGSHTWQVRAKNGTKVGDWSTRRAYTILEIPAAPFFSSPSDGFTILYNVSQTFSWVASPNATGYEIEFDNETPISRTTTTYSRSFTTLVAHTWKICAFQPLSNPFWYF